jgi:hypothetical protein
VSDDAGELVDWRAVTAKPLISMLWESVEPADALTERFGFADEISAARWLGAAVWDSWSVTVHDCDRLVISDKKLLAWVSSNGGVSS